MKALKKIIVFVLVCMMIASCFPASAALWDWWKSGSTTTPTTPTTPTAPAASGARQEVSGTVDEIVLGKTATETTDGSIVDGNGNVVQTYDIALDVQGKLVYPGAQCDIVLAIDLSNSMTNNGSKNLEVTKDAALRFIDNVIPDTRSNARIALVCYGTFARAYNFNTKAWDQLGSLSTSGTSSAYYTKDVAKAKAPINDKSFAPATLKPTKAKNSTPYSKYESGGTNTEAGFNVIKAVTDGRKRPDAQSYVVFMTDGLPTYYVKSNSEAAGDGAKTDATTFNKAVAAAQALSNAGNDIYSVGLFTGYEPDSYNMSVADRLLSQDASYTAAGEADALTFTESGDPYIKNSYSISSANDNVDVLIKAIYDTLTYRCFALGYGTVRDVIPADFELAEDSRAALLEAGCRITDNADGTTTLIFEEVMAADDKLELPVFTVINRDGGFGTKYTNSSAEYIGTLYTGEAFDLDFPAPVAGINPWTVDDFAVAVPGKDLVIDVTENDLFAKYIADGTSVTDYVIEITDAEGNPYDYTDFTVSVEDGAIVFNASERGSYDFYYVVKATADGGDDYAAGNSSTLASRPTKVTVDVVIYSISLKGLGYAYIFGYEPVILDDGSAEIQMAPLDNVTREQVSAMIMRMTDQKGDTKDAVYPLTERTEAHAGAWYERGIAYEDSMGAFDGPVYTGDVSRGEVARLIACGLNLMNANLPADPAVVDYTDIAESEYKDYIERVTAYGYMQGDGNGLFRPDDTMTRAEFCALFNRIIGRDEMGLVTADGTEITPELYSFIDILLKDDGTKPWYYDVCLKATSAYDLDGYVDLNMRQANMRNILDNYDAQLDY